MKRVYLITGAAGHLARTTIDRLCRQDCLIRGLILPDEPGENDAVISYYRGDVTKPETLTPFFSGLDDCEVIVLHMAALVSIQDEMTPEIVRVNVNGTKNIIEKCLQYHVKRLLYVSSVHAIPIPVSDHHPEQIPGSRWMDAGKGERRKISECRPVIKEAGWFSSYAVEGAYAATKAQATQLVLNAGMRGLDVVIVHPSAMIGPGDPGNNHVIQLMKMYLDHRLPFGVKGGYDFVDVRDVADGIVKAVDEGRKGECYLLTNRYLLISELLEYMRMAEGRKFRKPCCPLWLAKALVPFVKEFAAITGTRPLFTKCSLNVLGSNGYFCHDKATGELRFLPRDLKETVADTVAYLKSAGKETGN